MPSVTARPESARINLRTSPQVKEMIERAAAAVGVTVSSFMLQNSTAEARRVLAETETITLSQQSFDAFIAACENPPQPSEGLIKLLTLR